MTRREEGSAREEVRSKDAREWSKEEVGFEGGEGKDGQRTTRSMSL